MFKECPVLDLPVVPEHVPSTSWTTGIIFESEEDLQKRKTRFSNFQQYDLPGPFDLTSNCDIFIDGSCFSSRSKRFKCAAVGIYSPERGVFQYPVAGPDHSKEQNCLLWQCHFDFSMANSVSTVTARPWSKALTS